MLSQRASSAAPGRTMRAQAVAHPSASPQRCGSAQRGLSVRCMASSGAAAAPGSDDAAQPPQQPAGFVAKVKNVFFSGNKVDKAKLAEYGMGAFAAYGVISNANFGVIATIAWLAVVKQSGLTPLAPGMWPKFLALYAAMWVSSNFMRPIRLSLALAAAPFFNAGITATMERLKCNKAVAFGIMLFFVALGTIVGLVSLIAVCGGFPPGSLSSFSFGK